MLYLNCFATWPQWERKGRREIVFQKGDGCLQPAGSPNESDFWIPWEDFWNLAHVENIIIYFKPFQNRSVHIKSSKNLKPKKKKLLCYTSNVAWPHGCVQQVLLQRAAPGVALGPFPASQLPQHQARGQRRTAEGGMPPGHGGGSHGGCP